jgi:acyl-CoA reductase-like NAD-dependent aldehyde dehydrogenase
MTHMDLTGANLIAATEQRGTGAATRSVDPSTGEPFGPEFHDASDAQVSQAAAAAADAFTVLRQVDRAVLADLLEGIAARLEDLGDVLIDTAVRETGLGRDRITGERGRTCGQLRAFAALVTEGSHLDIRIDTADPTATPPRPDLRRMQVPLGPVAVFGASNFPLAFSVPGGDTASALAAGCPVIAKVHPSHPATSELCGRAIAAAIDDAGLPAGTFSMVHGRDVEVSRALVLAPEVTAVGFTGSEAAGRALFDLGAGRDEPIPVYAEMGSLNPQFITTRAVEERGPAFAEDLVGSMTMGTGQFCTKPGLLFIPRGTGSDDLEARIVDAAGAVAPGLLLNAAVGAGLGERLDRSTELVGVEVLVDGRDASMAEAPGFRTAPTVLATDFDVFRIAPELVEEHFGPAIIIVRVDSLDDMVAVAPELPGALTASLHGTDADAEDEEVARLLAELQQMAGRVVWNQFPTGVAVTPAMHHGGPYPATTSAAHTSVGTAAIRRFLRPVAYQNTPQSLLPTALRDANPDGLLRLLDGRTTDAAVG